MWFKFVAMIIKSALFFLRIFDFVCDSYDYITQFSTKPVVKRNNTQVVARMPKPSYSVVQE